MNIYKVTAAEEKKTIARQGLEALPEWFGIPQAREEYIADSAEQTFFAAEEAGRVIGFLCLKETGRDTMELAVMGVCREYHRKGCGRALFAAADDTKSTMTPIGFTGALALRSWRYSRPCGTSGTPARFM